MSAQYAMSTATAQQSNIDKIPQEILAAPDAYEIKDNTLYYKHPGNTLGNVVWGVGTGLTILSYALDAIGTLAPGLGDGLAIGVRVLGGLTCFTGHLLNGNVRDGMSELSATALASAVMAIPGPWALVDAAGPLFDAKGRMFTQRVSEAVFGTSQASVSLTSEEAAQLLAQQRQQRVEAAQIEAQKGFGEKAMEFGFKALPLAIMSFLHIKGNAAGKVAQTVEKTEAATVRAVSGAEAQATNTAAKQGRLTTMHRRTSEKVQEVKAAASANIQSVKKRVASTVEKVTPKIYAKTDEAATAVAGSLKELKTNGAELLNNTFRRGEKAVVGTGFTASSAGNHRPVTFNSNARITMNTVSAGSGSNPVISPATKAQLNNLVISEGDKITARIGKLEAAHLPSGALVSAAETPVNPAMAATQDMAMKK